MNLVDTSGWIEYFVDGEHASYFSLPIERTEELLVPVICIYEVFKNFNVFADEARAVQAAAQMKQGTVVDTTEDVALSAALISIKYSLPMADALIYATARSKNAVVWTQDSHFKDLEGVNYKPTTDHST